MCTHQYHDGGNPIPQKKLGGRLPIPSCSYQSCYSASIQLPCLSHIQQQSPWICLYCQRPCSSSAMQVSPLACLSVRSRYNRAPVAPCWSHRREACPDRCRPASASYLSTKPPNSTLPRRRFFLDFDLIAVVQLPLLI